MYYIKIRGDCTMSWELSDSLLIDVVDHAAASAASELSDAIERLPYEERMKILKVIRILTEK